MEREFDFKSLSKKAAQLERLGFFTEAQALWDKCVSSTACSVVNRNWASIRSEFCQKHKLRVVAK